MGNPFFDFLNTDQNAPKKKFRIEIWTFSFQICFENKFSTSGSGQTENTCILLILQGRREKQNSKAALFFKKKRRKKIARFSPVFKDEKVPFFACFFP